MRTNAVPKGDGADYPAFAEVDHRQFASVRTGHAHPRVAVDRNERPLAIGRCGDLMSRHASLGDRGDLTSRSWINQTESLLTFISDQQQTVRWRRSSGKGSDQRSCENECQRKEVRHDDCPAL